MATPKGARRDKAALQGVPEWVLAEPEKYQPVFMARLFDWALFGDPVDYVARDYFRGHEDGWTDEDTEYVYRRFVEEGYIASHDAGEEYVLADHGWPIERESLVMRRINGGAPERFDYQLGRWVVDWDMWYRFVINDNANDPIGRRLAEAIIREHGGHV